MRAHSRTGMTVAGASIAFSALCFALYFAFTPVLLASAIFGAIGAMFALACKARRTAVVTIVFALVPLAQLLVEQFSDTEYLVFFPAAMAIGVAAWAIVDYSLERRAQMRPAA